MLGVDVFFVLSGFLITRLLLAEHRRAGKISLGQFWLRRARRLVPALLITLIGISAFAKWVASPARVVPGTKMAFGGITSKKQQADVVAYLQGLK